MSKNPKEHVNKSRYGRVSTKRKYDEEFATALKESCDNIHLALGLSPKKNSSSSVVNFTNMRNGKIDGFSVGDIVWAKTGKYPIWPGIIISDPVLHKFHKNENNITMLHIYYCNDAYKRNWIKMKQIFEFSTKNKILMEFPKTSTQISRSKLKEKWNRAVDEAECLAAMARDIRITAFFANNFLPRVSISLMDTFQIDGSKSIKSKDLTCTNTKPDAIQIDCSKINKQKTEMCSNTRSHTIQKRKLPPPTHDSTDIQPIEKNHKSNDKQNILEKNPPITNQKTHTIIKINFPKDHPRILIPELCKLFYANGWVTGTGGGISIKYNDQIFIAPSGVQKERIEPEDLFVQNMNGVDIEVPPIEKNLTKSQCTPIFMCSYNERNAGAVIHIHSQEVVKLCLLNPENELRITDLEIIKGIYNEEKGQNYDNDEEVIIPIINNSKYERDLVDTFKAALAKYPKTSAVLVRNHGMYVWGKDWKSAKTQCECYEYAFNIMVFKKIYNL